MDIESKIWNYSSTGTKVHAFLDGVAICRSSIRRPDAARTALDYCEAKGYRVCAACETKFNAAIERAEASMQPSTGEGDYLPPAAPVTGTHHYNATGGQRWIAGRGWVNHCRVCQAPEGDGNHFHNPVSPSEGDHLPPAPEIVCVCPRMEPPAKYGHHVVCPLRATDTNREDTVNERRRTEGPLTPAQRTIIEALAAGQRQNQIAQRTGKSQQYISGEVQIITGKMGAKTTAEAVRIFATAQAYRNAAAQVRSVKIWSPVDADEEHVNHVLDGIADLFQSWHDQRMPQ